MQNFERKRAEIVDLTYDIVDRPLRQIYIKFTMMFIAVIALCGGLYLLYMLSCDPTAIRPILNAQSGVITPDMQRKVITPRANKYDELKKLEVFYGEELSTAWSSCEGDAYWNEAGQVEIS